MSNVIELLNYWSSSEASTLLTALSDLNKTYSQADFILKAKSKYSRQISPEILNTAVQVVICRAKLLELYSEEWMSSGFFLTKQLEQASKPALANFHAENFVGCNKVLDLCSGLGFDSFAIAKVVGQVIAVEADPLVATFTKLNAGLQGISNIEVVCSTAEEYLGTTNLTAYDAIWSDPDRRTSEGQRVNSVYSASPSMNLFESLNFKGIIGVKVSSATKYENPDWVNEFVGFDGECKEQILWRNSSNKHTKVSIVDANLSWQPYSKEVSSLPDEAVLNYLIEPHPALTASGLLSTFFAELECAVLTGLPLATTSKVINNSDWYSIYQVLETVTFRSERVNTILKDLSWGRNTAIKKIGLQSSAEEIRKKIAFPKEAKYNDHNNIIFVIKIKSVELAVFCKRIVD